MEQQLQHINDSIEKLCAQLFVLQQQVKELSTFKKQTPPAYPLKREPDNAKPAKSSYELLLDDAREVASKYAHLSDKYVASVYVSHYEGRTDWDKRFTNSLETSLDAMGDNFTLTEKQRLTILGKLLRSQQLEHLPYEDEVDERAALENEAPPRPGHDSARQYVEQEEEEEVGF